MKKSIKFILPILAYFTIIMIQIFYLSVYHNYLIYLVFIIILGNPIYIVVLTINIIIVSKYKLLFCVIYSLLSIVLPILLILISFIPSLPMDGETSILYLWINIYTLFIILLGILMSSMIRIRKSFKSKT